MKGKSVRRNRKSMMKNKKGIDLNQGFGAILVLVLVAVMVIVGIVLFVSLISGPFSSVSAVSVVGEALTPSGAGVAVDNSTRCSFGSFSLVTALNASGFGINSGNWTTTSLGVVTNTSELTNSTAVPWTINYTYRWGSEACTAAQATITQFGTYPALVGLVGTIIFLGIVIGVLVASFVFGGRRAV